MAYNMQLRLAFNASLNCILYAIYSSFSIIILTAKLLNFSMVCQKGHNFIKDLWLLFIYAPLLQPEM